jgi:hypothetical protein
MKQSALIASSETLTDHSFTPKPIMNIILLSFIGTFAWMVVRAFQQDRLNSDSPRDLLKEDLLFIKGKLAPAYRVVLGAAQLVAGIIAAVVEVYSSTQVQDWILTTRQFVSKNAPIAKKWAQESWQRLQHRQTVSPEAQPSEAVVTVAAAEVVEDPQPAVGDTIAITVSTSELSPGSPAAPETASDSGDAVTAAKVIEDPQTAVGDTIAITVSTSELSPGSLAEPETASDSGAVTSARGRNRSSRRARQRTSS